MAVEQRDCDNIGNEIIQKIKLAIDNLASLKETDNILRQRTLRDIEQLFLKCNKTTVIEVQESFLEHVCKVLFECLKDRSEKCRELSAKILCNVLDYVSNTQFCIPYISSILVQRLGKTDEREHSEEVRLLEIHLLYKLIKNAGDLLKDLNDISNILIICITDDYPEVKRKSCECASLLAEKQPNFHMISSSLLKSLLQTISHQHFRTRSTCVQTIGHVVCKGSSKDFEDAVTHVAQRLFDHSPIVRKVVTEVIGFWLLQLPDRYSFFGKLIPLMLSTLHDFVSEIKEKGRELWNKAGEQYLSENESDYKDLIDFPKPDPENYIATEKRPSLGCRILVQRNMHCIIPPLVKELTDWVPETRLKSVQVLYSLILHAENKATIQLSAIIDGIVSAAKDEENKVAQTALQCAEMLGFFLDLNLVCDAVLTLVYKSPSAVHLSLLAAILRGNKRDLPKECFNAISKLLSSGSVCRLRQANEQANLLLCIEGILSSHNEIDQITSYQIFTVLCTISGLTSNDTVTNKALTLLNYLASRQSCSLLSLFKTHALVLLNSITSNYELWTSQNPELQIFYFIVQSDYSNEDVLITAIPIITHNLNLNKDIKLRSQIFTLIVKVFKKLPSSQDDKLSQNILDLIRNGVFPNLTWAPGKAASSLRIVAVASLYEIISKDCIDEKMIKSIGNELLPIIASLFDDDEVTNRLLACKILEFLLPKLYGCVDDLKIHSISHDFLQCMDDSSDDIRILATKVLKAYIMVFPKDYCWSSYRSYLKEIFQNVIIHMDDKNDKIKENVFNLLKDIAFVEPQLLLNEIENKKYMMAASNYCEDLLDHVKKMHI